MLIQIAPADEGGPSRFVERDALDISHHCAWRENSYEHAIEYRLEGELVRRDVWVNVLRGQSINSDSGKVG